jgi:hypothetical protein
VAGEVADAALTPALALDYLDELSTDIRGGLVLDRRGELAAAWHGDAERGERMREPLVELLRRADAATRGRAKAAGVEVATARGSVFAVRSARWTLAVITGRFVLSSLMLFDLRKVLDDLDPPGARGS